MISPNNQISAPISKSLRWSFVVISRNNNNRVSFIPNLPIKTIKKPSWKKLFLSAPSICCGLKWRQRRPPCRPQRALAPLPVPTRRWRPQLWRQFRSQGRSSSPCKLWFYLQTPWCRPTPVFLNRRPAKSFFSETLYLPGKHRRCFCSLISSQGDGRYCNFRILCLRRGELEYLFYPT